MAFSNFLDFAESVINYKKTEGGLPICKMSCQVVPFLTGDDLALRTSVTQPDGYDKDLNQLLCEKTKFFNPETKEYQRITLDQFKKNLSIYDRKSLLYMAQSITYETLGKRNITCPKSSAEGNPHTFEREVFYNECQQEDTFKVWDKEKPFTEYTYPIECKFGEFNFVFNTKLPSLERSADILSYVDIAAMQRNFRTEGTPLSRANRIALYSDSIELYKDYETENKQVAHSMQEIMAFTERSLPLTIAQKVLTEYDKHFGIYEPKFYVKMKCPICGHEFDYILDTEWELLFRVEYS